MAPKKEDKKGDKDEVLTRIAIVSADRCKPKKCRQECKKSCPVVKVGKLCIEVVQTSQVAWISEELCIGCGICVKKCPFEAIQIINLPKDLAKSTTHRYGANSFKLHRLPVPRPGQVLGLVGTNGIGKSTALKVLAGKLKPNLGRFGDNQPDWQEILSYFRGSELQNYFTRVLENDLKAVIKPQYVDHIPKAVRGNVGVVLKEKDQRGVYDSLLQDLDLEQVTDRNVENLSGGELQRFAIAVVAAQAADVYMIDEPSSYLDVRQRLKAAQVIRSLLDIQTFVIVVEHDLSVLDYLSDYICCLYGKPGAYGVVTLPFSVREGINIFLAGFVPTENLRFREEALTFKVAEQAVEDQNNKKFSQYTYPSLNKTQGNFTLNVEPGDFTDSEIIVMLGENGTGKTTFIRMLAGMMKSDDVEEDHQLPQFNVSYKPQKISPKFEGTVRLLLHKRIQGAYLHPQFITDVMKPLNIENVIDQEVQNLSGVMDDVSVLGVCASPQVMDDVVSVLGVCASPQVMDDVVSVLGVCASPQVIDVVSVLGVYSSPQVIDDVVSVLGVCASGSRAIGFWAHFMFGLERDQQAEDIAVRQHTTFRILKDRFTGQATGKTIGLGYDVQSGRLFEQELEESPMFPDEPGEGGNDF
ncbi:MAG: hypothetical protein WDW36_001835 [Sanguina aurantia]